MTQNKVLYISPCSERAGAEQLTKQFILNHSAQWKPSLYFLKDGPFVAEMRSYGISCSMLPRDHHVRLRNPLSVIRAAHIIAEYIKSENISLVHSVMGYGHILGGLAAQYSKCPEVWYQHGPTGNLDYLTGRIPTQCILTNSNYTLSCQKKYFARTKKIKLIYPAVSTLNTIISPADARARYNMKNSDFVFGLAGRMSPMKGQLDFIDAALKLLPQYPHLKYLLVGSSFENHHTEYEKKVFDKINNSSYRDRFTATGFIENAQEAMQACDVMVNATTTAEPFGLTLIEALQLGKPVIAPAQGGPLEIIDSQQNGLFFEPKNTHSLATQMKKMIHLKSEPIHWEQYTKAALLKVATNFELSRMMRELESTYEEALKPLQ